MLLSAMEIWEVVKRVTSEMLCHARLLGFIV